MSATEPQGTVGLRTCLAVTAAVVLTMAITVLGGKHFMDTAALTPTAAAGGGAVCEYLWAKKEALYKARRGARQRSLPDKVDAIPTWQIPPKPSLWDFWEPEWTCESEERFGNYGKRFESFGDGPKFVCGVDAIRKPCLVYSIGSNQDYQFEKSVKEIMGCEVFTFDPTLTAAFTGAKYSTFHAERLGPGNNLRHIMKKLGHVGRHIDILKWDCEGCEWGTLPAIFEDIAKGELSIGQVQLEMHISPELINEYGKHKLGKGEWGMPAQEFFQLADQADMYLFHKERNTFCLLNACLEYAWVSKKHAKKAFELTHCPATLAL